MDTKQQELTERANELAYLAIKNSMLWDMDNKVIDALAVVLGDQLAVRANELVDLAIEERVKALNDSYGYMDDQILEAVR